MNANNQSTVAPPRLSLANRVARLTNALRNRPHLRPLGNYASSIVDSEGCEFGYEMFYHIPYAHHLAKQGLLERTVSCQGTKCFYFFSPDHREVYSKRHFVKHHLTIDQVPHARPRFDQWTPPDFAAQYRDVVDFHFPKPLVLIFNKFNVEWDHPPINFLSPQFLKRVTDCLRDQYTLVYLRPTSHIVDDHMAVGEMNEKSSLRRQGVVMAEDLYQQHSSITFNEFQLCLLSQSQFRIGVQGGGAYMNAFFPGRLILLHRYGGEKLHGNYDDFPKLGVTDFSVHDNEFEMLDQIDAHAKADQAPLDFALQRRAS